MGTSGKNEIFGGVFLAAYGDSVAVEKISVTMYASDSGRFENILIIAATFDDGFELVGNSGGEAKSEILIFEFGEGEEFSVGMRKIQSYTVGNVMCVNIGTTEKTTFDNGNMPFGFSEVGGGSRPGGAATDNYIIKIVFLTHFILFYHDFYKRKLNQHDIF